jgi:hypothetical protein
MRNNYQHHAVIDLFRASTIRNYFYFIANGRRLSGIVGRQPDFLARK